MNVRATGLARRVLRQHVVAHRHAHLLEGARDVPQHGQAGHLGPGDEPGARLDARQLRCVSTPSATSTSGTAPARRTMRRAMVMARSWGLLLYLLLHHVQVFVQLPDVAEHGGEVHRLGDVETFCTGAVTFTSNVLPARSLMLFWARMNARRPALLV
jgi:hypothetical protein